MKRFASIVRVFLKVQFPATEKFNATKGLKIKKTVLNLHHLHKHAPLCNYYFNLIK